MRQRVMIAIALACDPDVLIADEPTTALDVTIQAQILELVKDLRQKLGMAIIWITHDLGVIAGIADRVMVMYGGQVVEQAPVRELFANPQHPYTRALLKTIPKITGPREARLQVIEGQPPILTGRPDRLPVPRPLRPCLDTLRPGEPAAPPRGRMPVGQGHDVACHWVAPHRGGGPCLTHPRARRRWCRCGPEDAFPDLHRPFAPPHRRREGGGWRQLRHPAGETLGWSANPAAASRPSGARLAAALRADRGVGVIDGEDIATMSPEALRKKRPTMQMVFQDPQASLNPRMTLADHRRAAGRTHQLDPRKEAGPGL
jgi:ABC-type dipeptide/oligopeptide/nickel transport system ATPase component